MKTIPGLIDVPGKDALRPHARNVDPYVAPNLKPLTYVQSQQFVGDFGAPTNAKYTGPYGSQSPASAQFTQSIPTSVPSGTKDKKLGTMQPGIPRQPFTTGDAAPTIDA